MEPRKLLAFGSLGPEFLVNTTTDGDQYGAVVAADPSGNFVVAWVGFSEGSSWDIYARRYDASGAPLGDEFLVNTTTAGDQTAPSVATDGAGGFVVAWSGDGNFGGYARRYGADGSPHGGEFRADDPAFPAYGAPSIAMDADGDFVVAWDNFGMNILARRFDPAAQPIGDAFVVSEPDPSTFHRMLEPSVAMDADGDFVVTWTDQVYGLYGVLRSEVHMRRYDSAGEPAGGDGVIDYDGYGPAVAMDADGDSVVTWNTYIWGPYAVAQRFNVSGGAAGPRIDVSFVATDASAALGADGTMLLTWFQWDGSFSGNNVHGQRFDAASQPLGPEFRVNTQVGGSSSPVVAADGAGRFVVAWNSFGQDGSGSGVYGQRFGEGGAPPPPPPPSITVSDVTVTEGNAGTVNAVFTVSLSAASPDVVTVDYATSDAGARAGSDYAAASGTVTFAPGQTSRTVAIAVNGDVIDEFDQGFALNLSNSVNADIGDSQGIATILDDDAPPTISINDVSLAEGRTGTTAFTFTVSLSAPSEKTVQADYSTANGTATLANADYFATSGTLVFAAGQATQTIVVHVVGDKKKEANEFFLVNLSGATDAVIGDGQGRGNVLNDDGP